MLSPHGHLIDPVLNGWAGYFQPPISGGVGRLATYASPFFAARALLPARWLASLPTSRALLPGRHCMRFQLHIFTVHQRASRRNGMTWYDYRPITRHTRHKFATPTEVNRDA